MIHGIHGKVSKLTRAAAVFVALAFSEALFAEKDGNCSFLIGEISINLPYQLIGDVRVISALKINSRLVKEAEFAGRDPRIQKELDSLIEKEAIGQGGNFGMWRLTVGNGYYESRGKLGGRVYFKRIVRDGIVHLIITGKATKKGSANDQRVFKIMREVFPDFPPPPKRVNVKQ